MAEDYVYKPRVVITVSQEMKNIVDDHIPHGLRNKLFLIILDDLCTALKDPRTKEKMLGMVASGRIKIKNWSRLGEDNWQEEGKTDG